MSSLKLFNLFLPEEKFHGACDSWLNSNYQLLNMNYMYHLLDGTCCCYCNAVAFYTVVCYGCEGCCKCFCHQCCASGAVDVGALVFINVAVIDVAAVNVAATAVLL